LPVDLLVRGRLARFWWLSVQQLPSDHEQIDQGTAGEQPVGILVDPPVADLGEAEHPLHHAETVFNLGTDLGFALVFGFLGLVDHALDLATTVCEIPGSGRTAADDLALAAISLIAPDPCFIPMQQVFQHRTVMSIRGCGCHGRECS
jgi:hypothetical protein